MDTIHATSSSPSISVQEMDTKITDFTELNSDTFEFDKDGFADREKLRKYCIKIIDHNSNHLEMDQIDDSDEDFDTDDFQVSDEKIREIENFTSNALLCLKILLIRLECFLKRP